MNKENKPKKNRIFANTISSKTQQLNNCYSNISFCPVNNSQNSSSFTQISKYPYLQNDSCIFYQQTRENKQMQTIREEQQRCQNSLRNPTVGLQYSQSMIIPNEKEEESLNIQLQYFVNVDELRQKNKLANNNLRDKLEKEKEAKYAQESIAFKQKVKSIEERMKKLYQFF